MISSFTKKGGVMIIVGVAFIAIHIGVVSHFSFTFTGSTFTAVIGTADTVLFP